MDSPAGAMVGVIAWIVGAGFGAWVFLGILGWTHPLAILFIVIPICLLLGWFARVMVLTIVFNDPYS